MRLRSSLEAVDGPKNAVHIFLVGCPLTIPSEERMRLTLYTFSPGTWKTYQGVGQLNKQWWDRLWSRSRY